MSTGREIEELDFIVLEVPYSHHGTMTGFGGRDWVTMDLLLVKMTTKDGVVGWGEAFGYNIIPATLATLREVVAPLVVGQDAGSPRSLANSLNRNLHLFGRSGPIQYGISGVEIACWDIVGKTAGKPLWALLGGEPQKLKTYASLLRYADEGIVGRAVRDALSDGFEMVKLHEVDPKVVNSARDSGGPEFDLATDVNCSWSPLEARDAVQEMEYADLVWIEEPIWPPEQFVSLEWLRRFTAATAIAGGENLSGLVELGQSLSLGGYDVVQPSIVKIGGVAATLDAVTVAQLAGRTVTLHSPFFGPGLVAALHVAAAAGGLLVEWLYCDLEVQLFEEAVAPVDGAFDLPCGPGLGSTPNPEAIERFRVN